MTDSPMGGSSVGNPPQETTPIPVMGAVTAPVAYQQQSQKKHKPGFSILVLGIILCFIALAALAAVLVFAFMRPFSSVDAPAPPQISQVEKAFSDAKVKAPDLSSFMYIKIDGMSEPELSNYKTGNVTEDPSAKGSFHCDGTADSTVENEYVKAVTPLTVKMTHAANSEEWVAGGVDEGAPSVSPTGPADMEAIQANMQNILKGYDQDLANQFVDCEVRPEASLNTQGGTIIFNLSKVVGEETKTCAVSADVTWGNNGWDIKVTGVDGLEAPAEEQPAEPEEPQEVEVVEEAPAPSENQGGGTTEIYPTMLLECWSGDLVRIPGTIQVQDNGSVLLRTDDVIRVVFNGMNYITTYFELTGSGSWQNGQHVIVEGAISATGTNPIAPLVINLNYI
ncbi:MAG: hypothetical protein HFJ65_05430 [Eggerthellaceae bacterium]|nr:hypothetical protein [Eggerthellaceae bacterium]